jgi:hypothetical protein
MASECYSAAMEAEDQHDSAAMEAEDQHDIAEGAVYRLEKSVL